MMTSRLSRIILSLIFITLTSFYPVAAEESAGSAVQWMPWEQTLASVASTAGPVLVEVLYSGPSGSVKGVAFTDDGIHYTIRMSFPEAGPWKWKTSSSDKKLDNLKGIVEVSAYVGSNPLYHHGDLRVNADRRFLIHEDGTPFLWIGDTGWNATYKSTLEEWKTYVDTRVAQHFSVIQINPRGVGNRATSSAGEFVSFRPDGTNDPEFWSDLEAKIRYANEKGILIMLTGVGDAWRNTMAKNPQNQKFETYISGRMAGFLVILSPSFDQLFSDELDRIAAELQKWTNHLVTQHPGTNLNANMTFRSTTSVDFSGLQTGHQGGDIVKVYSAARQWTLDLWGGTPVKPVILLEAMYDAHGNNDASNWREKDARKPGWIGWLSGAKGFTYGAGDIPPKVQHGKGAVWMFNKDTASYDYWGRAIQWESAWQITHMHDFLESIEWWNLYPSPDLIRNQPQNDTLQMMLAKTADMNLIVAYMPDNPRIVIDMSMYVGNYNYTWYNPQTGRYSEVFRISGSDPNKVFNKPESWEDAVLKIYRR